MNVLKWICTQVLRNRWATVAFLAAVFVAESTLWPPVWWPWMLTILGWVWAAFRTLPDTVQLFLAAVAVGVMMARWVFRRFFWHIVFGTGVVLFLPVFGFGTKVYILFYGSIILFAARYFWWAWDEDRKDHFQSPHPMYDDRPVVMRREPWFG